MEGNQMSSRLCGHCNEQRHEGHSCRPNRREHNDPNGMLRNTRQLGATEERRVDTASRNRLLLRIQTEHFVLLDTHLFLDSHPDCQMALEYYDRHRQLLREAQMEFVRNFGPLYPDDFEGGNRWTWVDGPWPWEMEANV